MSILQSKLRQIKWDAENRSTAEHDAYLTPSVFDHLVRLIKMWWRSLTMRVTVPQSDMESLKHTCGLKEHQIVSLYKQFLLIVDDSARNHLTVKDLELHSTLLARNPLKKYAFRMLFWDSDRLTFREFASNLSLVLSNSIGCQQVHTLKSMYDMSYFNSITSPRDVAQTQKLLALFNCFDLRKTGTLDAQSLCPLVYDLLRCDSNVSVSSLVPHSMINRMVNTAIACVHDKFPKVCQEICSADCDRRGSTDTLNGAGCGLYEGHRMVLTKELFVRDQEDLHLDQLMSMRL